MNKSRIIDDIIDNEGGGTFVNDPADSGGATRYGITEDVARRYGYGGDMRDLPRSTAVEIYTRRYWDAVAGDAVEAMSEPVVAELVDTGVNLGPRAAGTMLQRALNAMNNRGARWPDLVLDGSVGPATLAALKACLDERYERELLKALNVLQGAFYIELVERRQKDERFLIGWLRHRVSI